MSFLNNTSYASVKDASSAAFVNNTSHASNALQTLNSLLKNASLNFNRRSDPSVFGSDTLQGARDYNEDMSSVVSEDLGGLYKSVFGVHDGHGGSRAVKYLVEEFNSYFRDKSRLTGNPIRDISIFYKKVEASLEKEASGVVSVICIVNKDASVVFGWIGDCEGSLFQRNGTFTSGSFPEIDYAEKRYVGTSGVNGLLEHETAKTRPHCLGKDVILNNNTSWTISSPHQDMTVQDLDVAYTFKEVYIGVEGVKPILFRDSSAQHEFEMVKMKNPTIDIGLDVTKVKLGDKYLTTDTRISRCVQPTRSIGDWSSQGDIVLREPSVLMIPKEKRGDFIVLCSDGVFHSGAFKDMAGLVSFVVEPLKYVIKNFYHEQQDVYLRMKMCSNPFNDDTSPWTSWREFVIFLREVHLWKLKSAGFALTFQPNNATHYQTWLKACESSIEWVEKHVYAHEPAIGAVPINVVCSTAAHLAIIMGSSDNVTVLISKV